MSTLSLVGSGVAGLFTSRALVDAVEENTSSPNGALEVLIPSSFERGGL